MLLRGAVSAADFPACTGVRPGNLNRCFFTYPTSVEDLTESGLRSLSLVLALRPDVLKRRVFHAKPRENSMHDAPTCGYVLGTGIELERRPVERLSKHSVGVNHGELRRSEGVFRPAASGEFGVKMIH